MKSELEIALRAAGKTQTSVAIDARVTQSHLSRVVSGERNSSRQLREKIAEVVGRPVDEVFPRAK